MTCRDVMTADPVACLPNDPAARAAEIMRDQNVGAVPVVNDLHERRLIGIVTDRDLALQVLGDSLDPQATKVEDVMTSSPIACHGDDDFEYAIETMENEQIRRLPVVDEDDLLIGIISQADVARHCSSEEVGEMVEEISEPASLFGGLARSVSPGSRVAGALVAGASAMALGAAAMYALDPEYGRRRRAFVRDKAYSAYARTGATARATARDLRNRTEGLIAESKHLVSSEPVSDDTLVARVRSRIGRVVARPNLLHVSANEGRVRLLGAVGESECDRLVKTVSRVPGVKEVENLLSVHDDGDTARRGGSSIDLLQHSWSPATRLVASAVGGSLALYGLSSHSRIAKAAATLGLGLLTRGLTNYDFSEAAQSDALQQAMSLDKLREYLPFGRKEPEAV